MQASRKPLLQREELTETVAAAANLSVFEELASELMTSVSPLSS
jgi:hypothetical protein